MKNVTMFLVGVVIILSVIGLPIVALINPTVVVRQQVLVDVIQQVKPGVVHIMCPQWQGSGFIISEHLIATARHVVEGVEDFEITFDCGGKVKTTRAISSKDHDVAFIWVDEPMPKALILGSIKDCKLGESIFVMGSPYGQINFNAVSLGIISGLDRSWEKLGDSYGWSVAFTTDSAGHPGNSGCPVFSMDGKVRGILVGGFSPVLISVMPSDLFLDDLDEIELMFKQDEYQKEVKTDVAGEAWNYK